MKQLTVIVCPINAVGHVNACIGTSLGLIERGHRVVFVVEQAWKGKLTKFGVQEYLYSAPSQAGKNTADMLAQLFVDIGLIGPFSPKQKSINCLQFFKTPHLLEEWQFYNEAIKSAIQQFEPHVIISDENGLMPAIYYSGVPWIRNFSCNPTFFVIDKELPPGGSGLPLDDQSEWEDFNSIRGEFIHSSYFNDFIEKLGYPRYPDDIKTPRTESLIVYATPEEWNYPALRERPHWFNLEVFNKNESRELVDLSQLLPKDFLADTLNGNYSGKLIYVSMGSMGSIDLDLMQRLLKVLADTPHKYIVSKGPLHDKYELAGPNQWGDRFLPQLQLMPHMDLVITHGGNNSTTETFAQGKPMIVLPLFADQFDNAQRLHETGYAVKIDPYNFSASEVTEAIDQLLGDAKLKVKLEAASKRIQSTNRHKAFALKVEELLST